MDQISFSYKVTKSDKGKLAHLHLMFKDSNLTIRVKLHVFQVLTGNLLTYVFFNVSLYWFG